jgi:beta-galactosidase/beta-glucuronidase
MTRMGGEIDSTLRLASPSREPYYRLEFENPRALGWTISELQLSRQEKAVPLGGPFQFSSAWKSATAGWEWIYVDLGASSNIDRVVCRWLQRATEGSIQVSDDAVAWKTVQPLPSGGSVDDLKLKAKARYLRVLMTRAASPQGYALTELEVYGTGGLVARPQPAPTPAKDGRLDLAAGKWRVQRDSLVKADGSALSRPGFQDADWIPATVPGTILSSYVNAGALPDPNFGDNQMAISDAFFYADFWYRDEFIPAPLAKGQKLWLNFDGINWKAEVFLNGQALGRIEGGFQRARYDVTRWIRPGESNALAVRIIKNSQPGSVKEKTFDHPDTNGGILGTDNPTYHASIGWDWIPTIRGRNTGIWNDVYLTRTGAVTLEDPSVQSVLQASKPLRPEAGATAPATARPSITAEVTLGVTLRNPGPEPCSGTLRGRFGEISFERPITLAAGQTLPVKLDPSTVPALTILNPRLWWPAGYGSPELYPVELRFETTDGVSDAKSFQAGIRQFTYRMEDDSFQMWVNGRRFIPRGGNWGFPESMLRYRGREYDAAVRYHADMHFNMIRNWVGQTGDDEFYEACDRHGVVVWQDFWLANPWDGDDPDSATLFMANASDMVRRIRTHPSVGFYCGRNEGYPPKPIDDAIRGLLTELHPGLPYLSSSADDVATGHGPYQAMPLDSYAVRPMIKLHSEMGMPNIPTYDSLKLMMPESAQWPMGPQWGLHDFCLGGAQGGSSYLEMIRKSYGYAQSAAEWTGLAQFLNYDGYRAMFEGQGRNRQGLLIWMSHPAWPSFVWQTYDYFLEPTAAYFAAKKACEPIHIQWNARTDKVEVVNYNGGDTKGLTAVAQLLNLDGSLQWESRKALDTLATLDIPGKPERIGCPEDSCTTPILIQRPVSLSPIYFIRLRLMSGEATVSENTYCRGLEIEDTQALRQLPKARLEAITTRQQKGECWQIVTELRNVSSVPALMVRLKAIRENAGDRILPVLYSDNYLTLMPGEKTTIHTELRQADTRGQQPRMLVEGFNVGDIAYPLPVAKAK